MLADIGCYITFRRMKYRLDSYIPGKAVTQCSQYPRGTIHSCHNTADWIPYAVLCIPTSFCNYRFALLHTFTFPTRALGPSHWATGGPFSGSVSLLLLHLFLGFRIKAKPCGICPSLPLSPLASSGDNWLRSLLSPRGGWPSCPYISPDRTPCTELWAFKTLVSSHFVSMKEKKVCSKESVAKSRCPRARLVRFAWICRTSGQAEGIGEMQM